MSDLRAIVRIKHMAEAAAGVSEQPGPDEGREMAAAYDRLREEARCLYRRAEWGDDEAFERELPPLVRHRSRGTGSRIGEMVGASRVDQATDGRRARVLLGQLAAWATGHQEAFEVEERLKADAAARAMQRPKDSPGFR